MNNYKLDQFIMNGDTYSDKLEKILSKATLMDARVANLVQIVEHPLCIYDGKKPYSPLSEEIVGVDKYGKYCSPGDIIVLTIHGLGVLTPETLRVARKIGYIGNKSADLDRIFPNQDVISQILNEGLLPDGRQIKIISYEDYKESGVSDIGLLHGVVRTREQATYPSHTYNMASLSNNSQVITYCGGKERMHNLFNAWERKRQGGFGTGNLLSSCKPNRIFLDAEQKQLIATMANPIYGPCDGFFGDWPITNQDRDPLRFLLIKSLD